MRLDAEKSFLEISLAVSGRLGWTRSDGHRSDLRFGFNFEPDRLPQLLRELEALAES